MNKCLFIGRLTADPNVRISNKDNNELKSANFSLAVRRSRKDADGNYGADFMNCVAFGKTADIIEKYAHKGSQIFITSRAKNDSYVNKDGVKIPTVQYIVDEVELLEKKQSNDNDSAPQDNSNPAQQSLPPQQSAEPQQTAPVANNYGIPEDIEANLPWS